MSRDQVWHIALSSGQARAGTGVKPPVAGTRTSRLGTAHFVLGPCGQCGGGPGAWAQIAPPLLPSRRTWPGFPVLI